MRKLLPPLLFTLVVWASSCGNPDPADPEAGETNREEITATTTGAEPPEATTDPGDATDSRIEPTTNTATSPAISGKGMVSSAHPLATEAGLEVLAVEGNAFDAAVAVAASLGVVEPMMSGIGGYGATVVYDARAGETRFLEVGSRTPVSLDRSVFRPPTPGYEANRCGASTVATPGSVRSWEAVWREYGELE